MPRDAGVMVLFQYSAAKVIVSGDDELAAEVEEASGDGPFSGAGGARASDFEEFPSRERDGVLEVWFAGEGLADVAEDGDLRTGDSDTLESAEVEELRTEEGDILVVRSKAMVRPTGECVWTSHQAPRLVVEREVELGQVQGPPGLPPVEVL